MIGRESVSAVRIALARLSLAAFLANCNSSNADDADYLPQVTHRAQIEFSCPSVNVVVVDHYTYIASGCGCVGTYECGVSNGYPGPHGCLLAPPVHGTICDVPDAGASAPSDR